MIGILMFMAFGALIAYSVAEEDGYFEKWDKEDEEL